MSMLRSTSFKCASVAGFILSLFSLFNNSASARLIGPEAIDVKNSDNYVYKVYGASEPGSGVLIQLPDGKYAIATSEHVVRGLGQSEEVEIQFDEDNFIYVEATNVIKVPKYDIALILIDSAELKNSRFDIYVSAQSADQIAKGQDVFVIGHPLMEGAVSGEARVSPGQIVSLGETNSRDGYTLGYSSKTYVGMSGGGVYSKDGELIGIHGAGEAIRSGDSNKTGSNFAVQISDAIAYYRSQMSSKDLPSTTNFSRMIFDGNFKAALDISVDIQRTYPGSYIARYNLKCLESIVSGSELDKSKFPAIFDPSFLQSMQNSSRQDKRKGFIYEYKNDSLVSDLSSKSPSDSNPFAAFGKNTFPGMPGGFSMPGLSGIPGMSKLSPNVGGAVSNGFGDLSAGGAAFTDQIVSIRTSNWLRIMQNTESSFERQNIKGDPRRCLLFVTHSAGSMTLPPLSLETDAFPNFVP
jgi:hypothetical protein